MSDHTMRTEHEHDEHAMHEHAMHGHDEHAPHDHGDMHAMHHGNFQRLFWINLVLTVPTLVFSTGLQNILGLSGPRFEGSQWIPAAFGTAIFVLGGRVFLSGAVGELRAKQPGMMTLISLAILVALGYSLAVTFGLHGMDFWWELATLITIMLLGHWIEMAAVMGASDALGELAKLLPDEAEVLHGEHSMTMPVSSLSLGDLVIVRPGASVPVDGEVVDGASQVDESLLTGESIPVAKALGASVIAGSVNSGGDGETGALTVKVTKLGDDTALAGVMKLVAEAQASKSGTQLLADRAAGWLFYLAIAAAAITLVVWLLLRPGDPAFVLERVVTVLVIACPHALGLAIPLVAQLTTAIGARRGILVRSRAALEEARDVDVVLFDKTGTLTTGKQGLVRVVPAPAGGGAPGDEELVLGLAASVEAKSEHPIARAIVSAAKERKASGGRASGFTALAGRGATATVAGRVLTMASGRLVTERGIRLDPVFVHAAHELAHEGATLVYLLDETDSTPHVLGMFALADTVRPESVEAVALLKKRGIRVAMLTGDSHEVAEWVAAQLGITEVFAEVLPGQKSEIVARLQRDGRRPGRPSALASQNGPEMDHSPSSSARVAMVGDGVNDAPALTRADVGIAIGAGTDVAIESAGIVLASSDPRGVVDAITLSRTSYRKMLQNLAWGTGYNVLGLPLAAGVLAGVGFVMPPAVGAAVMSISTIVVALNAQLLRRISFPR
ncbi:MAG TPA: heavy metal translocating P-type ATPase [Pseudolysinimonas sp.]|nr:heavy metal translocating P-type ATPase [Pseudolysinimonas sp.]